MRIGGLPDLLVRCNSVDAVQEFTIETSSYAPEYGRQPGAQVAVVTRSGTNQIHGSAFDYLRNDKLDANNWFGNANGLDRPALRQNVIANLVDRRHCVVPVVVVAAQRQQRPGRPCIPARGALPVSLSCPL